MKSSDRWWTLGVAVLSVTLVGIAVMLQAAVSSVGYAGERERSENTWCCSPL